MVNKADLADPLVIDRLRRREKHLVVVSARTGEGLDELRDRHRARAAAAGRCRSTCCCPFDRGDLVSRLHDEGDGVVQEHVAEGTRVRARVGAALAAELRPFAVTAATQG